MSFLPENDAPSDQEASASSLTGAPDAGTPTRPGSVVGSVDHSSQTSSIREGEASPVDDVPPPPSARLGLIAVSGGGDFEAIRAWGEGVVKVRLALLCLGVSLLDAH